MWLGIDFGTCYSSAALFIDGVLKPVKEPFKHGYSFPSSVFLTKQSDMIVGQAAENQHRLDPGRYRREFKRNLGEDFPVRLGDRDFLPQDLISELLRGLKAEAEKMVNEPIQGAVLTVPAIYESYKRELMEQAGQQAGFEKVVLMEEPVAAALYYTQKESGGHQLHNGEVLLVYDLGGGTFDAALIQKQVSGFKLLAMPMGDENCGGIDFDREIYKDLLENVNDEILKSLSDSNRRDTEALRTRLVVADWCRNFKHQLSVIPEYEDFLPTGESQTYALTQAAFEAKIQPFLERSCEICDRLVKQAKLNWDRISRILLVGGSCRMPVVQKRLEQKFNRPIVQIDDPELAICYGAAIQGHSAAQYERGHKLYDEEKWEEAIAAFQEALRFNPNYAEAHSGIGNVLVAQDRLHDSISAYQRALQINPDSATIHNNLGRVLQKRTVLAEAIAEFRRALQLNSNLTVAHFNLSISNLQMALLRAESSFKEQNLQEAQKSLEKVLLLEPNSAIVHNCMGLLLEQQGNLAQATSEFERAISLNSELAIAHSNLGRVFIQRGLSEFRTIHNSQLVNSQENFYFLKEAISRSLMLVDATNVVTSNHINLDHLKRFLSLPVAQAFTIASLRNDIANVEKFKVEVEKFNKSITRSKLNMKPEDLNWQTIEAW